VHSSFFQVLWNWSLDAVTSPFISRLSSLVIDYFMHVAKGKHNLRSKAAEDSWRGQLEHSLMKSNIHLHPSNRWVFFFLFLNDSISFFLQTWNYIWQQKTSPYSKWRRNNAAKSWNVGMTLPNGDGSYASAEANFSHSYLESYFLGQFMTISEGWNINWLVNGKFGLHSSLQQNNTASASLQNYNSGSKSPPKVGNPTFFDWG